MLKVYQAQKIDLYPANIDEYEPLTQVCLNRVVYECKYYPYSLYCKSKEYSPDT